MLNYLEQVVTIAEHETGQERESEITRRAMPAPDPDAMEPGRAERFAWVEPVPDEDIDRVTVGADFRTEKVALGKKVDVLTCLTCKHIGHRIYN